MINLQAIVSLDTGDKVENIYIYEGDDIELLAEYFCERHSIKLEGKQYIINEIERQLCPEAYHQKTHRVNPSLVSINSQQMAEIYDYLHDEAWKQQERKNQATKDYQSQLNKECTGKPQINKKSQKIIHRSKSSFNIFQKLHDDIKLIQNRKQAKAQAIFNKEYPFKTENQRKQWEVRPTRVQQQAQVDRLLKSKSISQQRLQILRNESNSPMDRINGQELYKPKIRKDRIFEKVSKEVDQRDLIIAQQIQSKTLTLANKERKRIFPANMSKIQHGVQPFLIDQICQY